MQSQRPTLQQLDGVTPLPVVALLDNIRSMHNVGAIFRTADGVFLHKLYLCGITATPPRDQIRKTSLGAEETVPWIYRSGAESVVETLSRQGYQIVSLEHTDESVDYRNAPYRFPLCLVVGNEFHGIGDKVIEHSDLAIEIPMRGSKHSLNVSVAFAIAVFEIYQQWQNNSTQR